MKVPCLLTRALVTSFITVAIVLGAVFAVLSLRVRDQVRQAVADNFDGPSVEGLIAALPRLAAAVDPVSGSSMEEHWGSSRGRARGPWSRELGRASDVVETVG